MIIQLTGLSGAGKTTLAAGAKSLLRNHALNIEIIDGDVYRKTVCRDLGFTREDRIENIRRLGKIAWSFKDRADIVLIAAINPFEDIRNELKEMYGAKIVWIKCDLDVLIKRDPKELYKRALLHNDHPDKLFNLTGVNDTYEVPAAPDLIIDTSREVPAQSVQRLYEYLLFLGNNKKGPALSSRA